MSTITIDRAALAQEWAEPVATFDEVWNAIDWDKWRMEPIRELVRMIHSKTSPMDEPVQEPVQEPVARVAEVHMSRYTLEWTNGPLPEGTELYAAPPQRRLTDDEVGRLWFEAKIPGLTETSARLLIRAAEKMLAAGAPEENPSFG